MAAIILLIWNTIAEIIFFYLSDRSNHMETRLKRLIKYSLCSSDCMFTAESILESQSKLFNIIVYRLKFLVQRFVNP